MISLLQENIDNPQDGIDTILNADSLFRVAEIVGDAMRVIQNRYGANISQMGESTISSIIVGGEEVYEFNYELITLAADFTFKLGELPWGFYVDYVQNEDADDNDQGYIVGTKLGKAKKRGSWQIQYQWQTLEADATLALVTDSDFMGGGTDGEGHKISAAYAILDNTTLGFTYFDGEKCFDDIKCDSRDYDRLMLDAKFKY